MPQPRVVIAGAGFAGLFAAKSLARVGVDVIVIDRHNYHLFQPLLYQVAVAGLPPSDIAWPIRSILNRQRNATVLMDEVRGVDITQSEVLLADGRLAFDYLILATGATHSYFGSEEWEPHAPGLKTIDDATLIRRRILRAFEQAEMTPEGERGSGQLTFVIVGAGPTGVELAGTIAELAHHTLARDFRSIDPRDARIVLLEAGSSVLAAFDEPLRAYARRALERLGVEVRVDSKVTACDRHGVIIGSGKRLDSATVIWAAGVSASPLAARIGVPVDAAGRILVEPDLSLPGLPHIFAVGDVAAVTDAAGDLVPGIAPAAKQQGRYVAGVIAAHVRSEPPPAPFKYRNAGKLATIGRQAAVIEFPFLRLKGWLAWWFWGVAHIYFLIGVPSPLFVSLRWLWEYLTYGRGARLITGAEDAD